LFHYTYFFISFRYFVILFIFILLPNILTCFLLSDVTREYEFFRMLKSKRLKQSADVYFVGDGFSAFTSSSGLDTRSATTFRQKKKLLQHLLLLYLLHCL